MMIFIPSFYAAPLIQKDSIMVNDLFSKTKPQCVGVYVVDVPESFENGTQKATYDDFSIESQFIYPPAFKQRIELREKALRTQKVSQKNSPVLKEIIQLPDNQGVIFDRNISGQDDLGRILEAHVYINHIAFVITAEILDLSSRKYSERKKTYANAGFTEVEMNDKPTKLAAMRSLISRLNGRLDHEIPTAKGVCIPNGFIAEDGGQHEVIVGFNYENDDFIFSLHSDSTMVADGDTFFGRSGAINEEIKKFDMKTLKKYSLTPNSIPFEAWLLEGIQTYQKQILQVYDFTLYANEAVATPEKPLFTIGMNSEYKQTRYSEAQMVEIWDRIVNSLRYRPNAF